MQDMGRGHLRSGNTGKNKMLNNVQALKRENHRLQRLVDYLSHDDAFDVLTRGGFFFAAGGVPTGLYRCVLFDLDGVGALNATIGYNAVNMRVRRLTAFLKA